MLTVYYGTTPIHFRLTYSARKTLDIHVFPDATVQVIAPDNTHIDKVKDKVLKRARWITKQQRYFQSLRHDLTQKQYISGETHRYLGRQYRLRIRVVTKEREQVKLKGQFFYAYVHNKNDRNKVKRLMDNWMRHHARKKFQERLTRCHEQLKHESIPYPSLQLRAMPKRWGSCTAKGSILLNPELVKHPIYCIDYVIIHELCHLKHPYHDADFYSLKEKHMPDWQRWKGKLEGEH